MENVIISWLSNEDIADASKLIQTLHKTIVDVRKDIFIAKEEDWKVYLTDRVSDKDYVVMVAKEHNQVVGVCVSEIKHCGDGIETCIRDILFIDYIVVAEKYRGYKIGKKLLNEMKKIAKEKNIPTIELNVWGFNDKAIKFYEQNEMKPKRIIYEYFIEKGEEI